jgi:hypothetical protein
MMDLVRMCCRAGLAPADAAFLRAVLEDSSLFDEPPAVSPPPEFSWEDSPLRETAAPDDSFTRLLADEDTRDSLLDHPAVLRALLDHPAPVRVSTRLYFYVLIRHALRESRLDDRDLADYVASVLVAHAPASAQPATGARGALFYATDAFAQIPRAGYAERFLLGVRLADLALLATGVFADRIRYREKYRAAPGLAFYESVGRAQYRLAGDHHLAHEFQLEHVYQALAETFPEVCRALHHFSENLVFLGGDSTPGFNGVGQN